MSNLLYLDSSAILKLIVHEKETPDLIALLSNHPERVSSALARIEVLRAIRRAHGRAAELRRAQDVLDRIALIRIDDDIVAAAAELPPQDLRSLDAIHVATALSLKGDLAGLVSYDRRLAAAAAKLRLPILSPGSLP